MSSLQNKIDFTVLVKVANANPNGDPLNGNRPRTTYTGQGEISDVCIKRKIRNRLQDMGESVFVQSAERSDDEYTSLSERASGNITEYKSNDEYAKKACEKWIDVRMFGQVFAFKKSKDKKDSVSVGVRGPVSIHQAISCSPVDINSMQITKSVNSEPAEGKSSDTMGTKHFVEFGLYRIKGSVNVQLAEKTGFSEEDANMLKEALCTLFINDASSARPDGSMEVVSVYWWKHNNKIGQYSAAKVHDSLKITLKEDVLIPSSVEDYDIQLENLPELEPEIIEGM
ncbi:MAG: type I-C CRISPR-associated protein Cas7/Csd2 [Ruminococcus sp.]|uniref:Type I-C CRISPR-associated protein Cas7/Csd2 n=1 Tax=Schaedlerella arabinosiphila TaxID=2044587 RepID=A0A426DI59_9FIRM|nr:type I-C CRISPR-associated protein Cas7/Csd2 [Schaedlerella arabinosiphila]MCI8722882.1 type I-C CRISPR-associated protein Cas7/Csd2 [Ruminococcus sp.]RRK32424.1 type I-C CRISPR-associated protein Cas7/Csd2 [Schaedlerella arabinosiphila]